jgi:hypothetical protein
MRKHPQKRYFRFGCAVTLLLAAAFTVWLFSNTNQVPTSSFASTNALLVLQGPLNPHDEGVKDLWEHTLSSLRREEEWLEKVLRWLGMPLEMTVAFYRSEPSLIGIAAVNFPKGYRLLWIPFRIFGKHYKGAHYFANTPGTALGMYGGTLILADDEATFCLAIDNLLRAKGQKKFHLSPPRRLRDRYDFVGTMNPRFLLPQDYGQLPSDLAEVGIDIIGANELKGEVFWICQSEREAEAVMKALDRFEKEIAREVGSRGGRCSFRKWREGMFVWWEFRLTGFAFLP